MNNACISFADYQLNTSLRRPTAGMSFSFICTTDAMFMTLSKDQRSYCTLRVVNGTCMLDPSCSSLNTYTCNSNLQTYTITIAITGSLVTDSLHGSKWQCSNPFGGDESNEIVLYVKSK